MNDIQKICILLIDDLTIKCNLEYDKKSDKIIGENLKLILLLIFKV